MVALQQGHTHEIKLAIAANDWRRSFVDRWFFSGMAFLCALTAIIGFAPNSLAIVSGELPNPPWLVHLHAALMATWLLLLVSQASLVGGQNYRLHQLFGVISVLLVPLMWLVMAALVITTFNPAANPYSIALVQLRRLILFPAFWATAMLARRSNPDAHKRLQLWATLVLLDAALLRMPWLPDFGVDNRIAVSGTYLLLLGTPLIAYDLYRNGRVHNANVVAATLLAVTSLAASLLW
jgi:hypothetical protein